MSLDFFTQGLEEVDLDIYAIIQKENRRQADQIELIASENIVSKAVLEAQGSILTNKYAEGYPSKRYYGGCLYVDEVEDLAIERAKALFGCNFANVQPHSGSQANQAVFLGLLSPGDCVLGMSLNAGGHLTHGAKPNLSGKWFECIGYGLGEDERINLDEVAFLAKKHSPKLIIAGGSSYARHIDFEAFRKIADEVGAYLMVDMAHFAGLVAGKVYPSPIPYAHVVTTTTHKTLRGPRGGMILCQEEAIAKKINSAIFPGLQGGPLMHVIAGKAVALKQALEPEFIGYAQNIVTSAKALGQTLLDQNIRLVSGGTDSHLVLLDLTHQQVTGKDMERYLEEAGMTCNKNSIPNDPKGPQITSGIRLGTPAGVSRGFLAPEFRAIGHWIGELIHAASQNPQNIAHKQHEILQEVRALCDRFPIYEQM